MGRLRRPARAGTGKSAPDPPDMLKEHTECLGEDPPQTPGG